MNATEERTTQSRPGLETDDMNLCKADHRWLEQLLKDMRMLRVYDEEARERLAKLGLPSLRATLPAADRCSVYLTIGGEGDQLETVRPIVGVQRSRVSAGDHIIYDECEDGSGRYRLGYAASDKHGTYHVFVADLQPDDVLWRNGNDYTLAELMSAEWAEEFNTPY